MDKFLCMREHFIVIYDEYFVFTSQIVLDGQRLGGLVDVTSFVLICVLVYCKYVCDLLS